MPRRDGRRLDHKTLEVLRKEAVRRVVEDGASPEEVIRDLGFHRSNIYQWLKLFHQGGYEALNARPIPVNRLTLNAQRWTWLTQTLLQKSPRDYGYRTGLWTRQLLKVVFERELGLHVSVQTVGKWLRERLGVRTVNPLGGGGADQAMEQWKQQDYPVIQRQVSHTQENLYFADVGTLDRAILPTDGAKGDEAPSVTVLMASTTRGHTRFMLIDQPPGPEALLRFLDLLLAEQQHRILLIMPADRVHNCPEVRQLLDRQQGRLQLFLLPSTVHRSGASRKKIAAETDGAERSGR